jgi:hypothetical protein
LTECNPRTISNLLTRQYLAKYGAVKVRHPVKIHRAGIDLESMLPEKKQIFEKCGEGALNQKLYDRLNE